VMGTVIIVGSVLAAIAVFLLLVRRFDPEA
jgi:hypothetical protein